MRAMLRIPFMARGSIVMLSSGSDMWSEKRPTDGMQHW